MDEETFGVYKSNIKNEQDNITKNILVLEEQIFNLKSKLVYRELMFTLIENIHKIIFNEDKDNCIILIPLNLKDYFKSVFNNKKDIYSYLHSNLIQSGIYDFNIESHDQYRIRTYNTESLDKNFDTYLSITL